MLHAISDFVRFVKLYNLIDNNLLAGGQPDRLVLALGKVTSSRFVHILNLGYGRTVPISDSKCIFPGNHASHHTTRLI